MNVHHPIQAQVFDLIQPLDVSDALVILMNLTTLYIVQGSKSPEHAVPLLGQVQAQLETMVLIDLPVEGRA